MDASGWANLPETDYEGWTYRRHSRHKGWYVVKVKHDVGEKTYLVYSPTWEFFGQFDTVAEYKDEIDYQHAIAGGFYK